MFTTPRTDAVAFGAVRTFKPFFVTEIKPITCVVSTFSVGDGSGKRYLSLFARAINEYKMPIYEERLNEFLGPPLYITFERMYGVSPELASDIVDTYRVYYADRGVHECKAYDGILDLASDLKEAGVKLAIASSKPLVFLEIGVRETGAGKHIEEVVGPELKNHEANKAYLVRAACERLGIEPSKRVAMIGDRFYDIDGANEVGVTSIGVEYGFGHREEFEDHNADYIATTVDDLRKILL